MAGVGPARMSKRRLIAVLGTLRPWELRSPEISAAVEVGAAVGSGSWKAALEWLSVMFFFVY